MFPASIDPFKIQEKDLHQQAAQYRLLKSLERRNHLVPVILETFGRIMILSGRQLINQSRAAAH